MSAPTTHGACGAWWNQRGNQTGHCSDCHLTFASGSAFDSHQLASGCIDVPGTTRRDGSPLYVPRHDGVGVVWSLARDLARAAARWGGDRPSSASEAGGSVQASGAPCSAADAQPPLAAEGVLPEVAA